MLKVLKNLKKSWTAVIAIVILLCVQAWADLELPSYTSKIVNTGIQSRRNRKCFTRDNTKITDGYITYVYR